MDQEVFEKAYEKCGGCMSCGWKSGWWEVDDLFEPTNHPTRLNEYWAPCTNQDYPDDAPSHRGYYIYLEESETPIEGKDENPEEEE